MEVLDNDLNFRTDDGRVQTHPPHHALACGGLLHLTATALGLGDDLQRGLIGLAPLEDIDDRPPHRIQVTRDRFPSTPLCPNNSKVLFFGAAVNRPKVAYPSAAPQSRCVHFSLSRTDLSLHRHLGPAAESADRRCHHRTTAAPDKPVTSVPVFRYSRSGSNHRHAAREADASRSRTSATDAGQAIT